MNFLFVQVVQHDDGDDDDEKMNLNYDSEFLLLNHDEFRCY
jgi:hypothetical protein